MRQQPSLLVRGTGSALVITPEGCLDRELGELLLRAVDAADAAGLEIDLHAVSTYTSEGVAALAACRRAVAGSGGSLRYRTGGGAGRRALLAALRGAS